MDVSSPLPRVNGELLGRFIGQKVLLVCKQEGVEGNTMRVKAPDGAPVSVELHETSGYDTEYLEFEGLVQSPTLVQATAHTNFGNDLDMDSYNQLCQLINGEQKTLFY
mmetsp:Transcript_38446/g.46379  ORF Transcript_38446/g.46379 Transcript_38446/m.46379 type:complete len:108 (+) Transcript_38446:89-412(+)|eukprot:CAMPEP_0197858298 /NCGR_PEP_ID=MMETSP1438-20131217/32007_1 /TAXON_ID=1461541 /ORGANISM="Pterosperma sp., Strain CCMP1384" /LENGTH=107 /DNA_ID=CAMNT_0043474413 /DNA_START=78 /DNA_END=401 /DNA_ORIENTATION=+